MDKIKFYMNNPCLVVREIDEFCEVKINPQFTLGFDGSQWCTECMVGSVGQTPSTHECDQYQDVIDVINEESAAIIVMVEKRLLHDEPVEKKVFEEAIKSIERAKSLYLSYDESVRKLTIEQGEIERAIPELESKKNYLVDKIQTLGAKLERLDKYVHSKRVEVRDLIGDGDRHV